MSDHIDYCSDFVRQRDYDLWLSTLYAPTDERAALLSLYAFSLSLAEIRSLVSEHMLGEIRLQWWRDAFHNRQSQDIHAHPILAPLMRVIDDYHLSQDAFLAMIDAREFDLYDDPMPSMNDLEGYCGETTSLLFRLAVLILNKGQEIDCADSAGHAGVAYAVTHLMRSVPQMRRRGQLFIPLDLLQKHGLGRDEFMSGQWTPALAAVSADICAHIDEHLKTAQTHIHALPDHLRMAFLPLAFIPLYIRQIKAPQYNAFTSDIDLSPLHKMWRMWRYRRTHLLR